MVTILKVNSRLLKKYKRCFFEIFCVRNLDELQDEIV